LTWFLVKLTFILKIFAISSNFTVGLAKWYVISRVSHHISSLCSFRSFVAKTLEIKACKLVIENLYYKKGIIDFGQRNNEGFKQNRVMIVELKNILVDRGFLVEKLIFSCFRGLSV